MFFLFCFFARELFEEALWVLQYVLEFYWVCCFLVCLFIFLVLLKCFLTGMSVIFLDSRVIKM